MPVAGTTILELRGISKTYDSPAGAPPVAVLEDINLALSPGESLAIVGPSGSGKSTLLQIIGTLDRPSSGQVLLEGRNLGDLSETELAEVRNRRIGFVFQAHYLLPQCTVLENVLVPALGISGRAGQQEISRAQELLKRVGLAHRLAHRPAELSGGEQQRVAVARALMNAPALLLADEPTGSLDHASAEAVTDLLSEINRQEGVAMVVVTHAGEVARRMGRVMELREGKLK